MEEELQSALKTFLAEGDKVSTAVPTTAHIHGSFTTAAIPRGEK